MVPSREAIERRSPFAQSIDDFLDQHRNDQHINLYGKTAIAKAIAGAERKSRLFFDAPAGGSFDDDRIADTWLVKFMSMLSRGTPEENVSHIFDNVDFVIFNDDRCVAHFLINALARSYSIPNADAVSIVDALKILHPYGSIGDQESVRFGTDRLDWVEVAQGIKTYTEQVAVSHVLNDIRQKVELAECVVFLGFAYHSQNMRMLETSDRTTENCLLYDLRNVRSRCHSSKTLIARTVVPKEIHTDKLKCAALFDHYAKSLTGGD